MTRNANYQSHFRSLFDNHSNYIIRLYSAAMGIICVKSTQLFSTVQYLANMFFSTKYIDSVFIHACCGISK